MKKLLITLSILIFLSLLSIYIFIPGNITISKVVVINCNENGASRMLLQPLNWKKWWVHNTSASVPGYAAKGDSVIYKETKYRITNLLHNSVNVSIENRNSKTNSTIDILPMASDTIAIQWKANIFAGSNPIRRIQKYQQAVSIKNNMTAILFNLRSFLEKKENIYEINIHSTSTTDTLLVATKSVSPGYPATPVIYKSIKMLQKFIAQKGAGQTGAPMVNVTKLDDGNYQYMTAIPTNIALKDEGNIFFSKMVKGNFLVAEVRGGIKTVNKAMDNMDLYISDYKKTPMAIPFQSLITDRSKEGDTSKWLTKIYFPIYH